ncbi:MAG: hypothetical protein ACI9WC_001937 [Arenicella sp.]|jgi:hypothetical protein
MTENNKRHSAEIINPGLGDIEKVRDILFGKYVASFEQRFADLESRLEVDVEQLKERLTKKISSMDEMVNKSLEKLDQRIVSEQHDRDTELRALQEMLKKAETALQHSIGLMEDQANQDLSAIKASMDEQHQEMVDQVLLVQKDLVAQVEIQKQELQNDKVGRQSLALMLDEVAIKLRGN